jgi:ubiquinone/menaquinone biosynthesis C-methylase UbiE
MSSDPDSVSDRVRKERGFWSKVAPSYDSWVAQAYEDQYKTFKRHLHEAVGPRDRVLEVGTGTGNIALHLAPHVASVVGLDLSPEMVQLAKEKGALAKISNAEFRVGDAYDLPFEDGEFDKVVCVNALQTMKSPERAIREAHRVLMEGGEMVTITYAFGDSGLWQTVKLARWVMKYGKPAYWSNMKGVDLTGLFESAGFEIVEHAVIWNAPKVVLVRATRS